jgi:hypothetical protein
LPIVDNRISLAHHALAVHCVSDFACKVRTRDSNPAQRRSGIWHVAILSPGHLAVTNQ